MSPEDLRNLAHGYEDLADALVAWRGANPITDPALGEQFDDLVADLVGESSQLENIAVTTALQNLQTSVAGLQAATLQAKHALTVVKDATIALAIGAAAVGVVAALLAPTVSVGAVAGALGGLAGAVQAAIASSSDSKGNGHGS
jgi:alanine-alpha-ketoisovalerate/valine-pyruvate aminotransferase